MSYAIKAVFQNGVMVESFHLEHTDPYGHTVVVNGKLLKTGELRIDRQNNVNLAGDGTITVDYGRFGSSYHGLQEFFINEINRPVMTKFSLGFCNRAKNIWPYKFTQSTIRILCENWPKVKGMDLNTKTPVVPAARRKGNQVTREEN